MIDQTVNSVYGESAYSPLTELKESLINTISVLRNHYAEEFGNSINEKELVSLYEITYDIFYKINSSI